MILPKYENGAPRPDRLLGGRVTLVQPRRGFRAAIDPVLLAAAVPAAGGETVLELGCGTGAAVLCLAVRVAGLAAVGIELDPQSARYAAANVAANGLAARVEIIEADLRTLPAAVRGRQFDHVLLNPPYGVAGRERPPADPARAGAMIETGTPLSDWLHTAAARVRPGGTVTVIHRADRLAAVLSLLDDLLGDLTVLPLWPRRDVAAKRVIVRGRKCSGGALRLHPGLVLHATGGGYTATAEAILRDGRSLEDGLAGQHAPA